MGQLRSMLASLPKDRIIDVSCTVGIGGGCKAGGEDRLLRMSCAGAEWVQGATAAGRVVHLSSSSEEVVTCLLQ